MATQKAAGETVVTVAPITHRRPMEPSAAIAIPQRLKRHLGLDADASWIVADEVNRFIWPGPDLRSIDSAQAEQFHYGFLPEEIFDELRNKLLAAAQRGRLKVIARSS